MLGDFRLLSHYIFAQALDVSFLLVKKDILPVERNRDGIHIHFSGKGHFGQLSDSFCHGYLFSLLYISGSSASIKQTLLGEILKCFLNMREK